MTTQDLIDYYVNLLIGEYLTLSNASGMIALFAGEFLQDQIIASVQDGFNFSVTPVGGNPGDAAGAQLDAVAAYQGASRVIYGLPSNLYFQLADTLQPVPPGGWYGFIDALVGPDAVQQLFLTAEMSSQPVYSLTDNELYRLTQFLAQLHSMEITIGNIDALMYKFFGSNVSLIDNGNMTTLYIDLKSDTDTFFGVVVGSGNLPRSAGVMTRAVKADMLTNFFGLQDALVAYDSTFAGFTDALTIPTVGTFIEAA